MSEMYDAIARLADRLDQVEQAIQVGVDRHQSHIAAVAEQADRVDALLARLSQTEQPPTLAQPAEDALSPDSSDHSLLS